MEPRPSDLPVQPALPVEPADLPRNRRAAERRVYARQSPHDVVRQIVDQLADGIVIVSDEGLIRFVNPAAERLLGRTAAELVGQTFGYPLTSANTTEIEIARRGDRPACSEL